MVEEKHDDEQSTYRCVISSVRAWHRPRHRRGGIDGKKLSGRVPVVPEIRAGT